MSTADLENSPEVQRWFKGAGYQTAPERERSQLIAELQAFCTFVEMAPSELIKTCLRTTKDGHTAISTKGRRAMQASIEAFVAERGLAGHSAIVAGNRIRGFLVHNGVFIQGKASIR